MVERAQGAMHVHTLGASQQPYSRHPGRKQGNPARAWNSSRGKGVVPAAPRPPQAALPPPVSVKAIAGALNSLRSQPSLNAFRSKCRPCAE